MTRSSKSLLLAPLVLLLAACSINQKVTPVTGMDTRQVCVVVNPAVMNAGFLETFQRELRGKGYEVRQLQAGSSLIECPVVSTYTANWRWDLAMYMSYAEIKVYNNARPVGEAIYDARNGGGNPGKFIRAEAKIGELVGQLFPGVAGGPDAIPATGGQGAAPR